MTTPTASSQTRLKTVRTQAHPYCVVCSQSNPLGLGLEFTVHDDGSVSASLHGHFALEGFQGCLHGGMIASLLDGAMTNCLFAQGHVAMTAELKVRYRKPVFIGQEMIIRAWITAVPSAAPPARGRAKAGRLHQSDRFRQIHGAQ